MISFRSWQSDNRPRLNLVHNRMYRIKRRCVTPVQRMGKVRVMVRLELEVGQGRG